MPFAWTISFLRPYRNRIVAIAILAIIEIVLSAAAPWPFKLVVDSVLGDQPFLMGDTPTEIDAIAYAQLANIMQVPITSPVKDYALGRPNLVAYLERMMSRVA